MDLADAIVQTARPSICLDKEKTNYAKAGQRSTQYTRLYAFCGTIKTTKSHQSASNHRSIDHSYEEEKPVGASPGALWNVPSVGWSEAFLELRQCVASVS